MLNKELHQLTMGKILRDIYADRNLASVLGFKGGTCTYLFYNLPRFSVDLDFDLLSYEKTAEEILLILKNVLSNYGEIKESRVKRYTIFLLLSYGADEHNIKLEINTRMLVPNLEELFELKEYLGISVLSAKQEYLLVGKLVALTNRSRVIARDIFDIYYFLNNNWEIDKDLLEKLTKRNIAVYLRRCIAAVEGFENNQILQGLGELVSDKEKVWIKDNLKIETIFLLKNILAALSKN